MEDEDPRGAETECGDDELKGEVECRFGRLHFILSVIFNFNFHFSFSNFLHAGRGWRLGLCLGLCLGLRWMSQSSDESRLNGSRNMNSP